MILWTYRRPFSLAGRTFRVETVVTPKTLTSRLFEGERLLAEDATD